MTKPISLSHFLLDDNTQLRLYDMGRRVTKMRLSEFEKFEQRQTPYPYPYQQTAWLGLLFWNVKNKDQHNIWFIRMPLDEQGLINIASRDEFLDMLLARIGEQIASKAKQDDTNTTLSHALKDNPYVFKPTEENMAIFHAKASQTLGLPASRFLPDTISYLSNADYASWQHLGIQGFADIAVRHDQTDINNLLCQAVPALPEVPYCTICNALENEACNSALTEKIIAVIHDILNSDKTPLSEDSKTGEKVNRLVSSIRAIANTQVKQRKISVLNDILHSAFGSNATLLVIIAAKCWEALDDKALLKLYLEKLAAAPSGNKLFTALMADQMFMPGKREQILQIFRDPNRSEALSAAVGVFFQQMSHANA